jgi:cell division protein ZapA
VNAKVSVTVRIAGEEHTIRANAEPAYTRRCAKHVDERIHQIRMQAGLIEGHKAAILAALSIADECFRAQDELERLRRQVDDRAEALSTRIRGALSGVDGAR